MHSLNVDGEELVDHEALLIESYPDYSGSRAVPLRRVT
jgi:hypothetical protein